MPPSDLDRRAVACPGWTWLRGCPGFWRRGELQGHFVTPIDCPRAARGQPDEDLPDLSSPAAVGCLLELVRRAYDEPGAYARLWVRRWFVQRCRPDGDEQMGDEWLRTDGRWGGESDAPPISAPSEAAALVYALEAAPVRP